jgi:hypothetical protein
MKIYAPQNLVLVQEFLYRLSFQLAQGIWPVIIRMILFGRACPVVQELSPIRHGSWVYK